MKKTLFTCLIILISMFFMQNNVFAAYTENGGYIIDSIEEVKNEFAGKAKVEGNKITLTSDIEFIKSDCSDCEGLEKYDIVNLTGDYILDLNGYALKSFEFYVDGSLTINDSQGNGKFGVIYLQVMENAELVINGGIFTDGESAEMIDNFGKMTINGGTFFSVWTIGEAIINNGTFVNVFQDSGILTINGGTFIAKTLNWIDEMGKPAQQQFYSQINIDAETIINGGEFKTKDYDYGLKLYTTSEYDFSNNTIEELIGTGFVGKYELYGEPGNNEVYYTSLKLEKDVVSEMMDKIVPNGVWKVNSYKPLEPSEGQTLLTALMMDRVDKKLVKNVQAWYDTKPEEATVVLFLNDNSVREYTLKVNYSEPDFTSNKEVNNIVSNLKKLDRNDLDEETSYRVEDLYLINYLYSNPKGMDVSLALNFSEELIKASNGSNVYYRIIGEFGGGNPNGLYTYFANKAVVYFNNIAYKTINAGVNLNHLLYIPNSTKNTTDAYIDAAMKRIKNYLGTTNGINIEVGGTFDSLNYYDNYAAKEITWNEYGFIDEKTSGDYYYNITINGKTYKFAICKKDNLENPKYLTSDILSNIIIKSDSSELPLDTAITVEEVSNDTIKNALGTEKYKAFDITLYSNAKEEQITKLTEGKFEVNIPVPEELEGKNIDVFYVNDKGEKEEHNAEVKNGYVVFETNHFSTYALVENTGIINNIEVPKTADVIIGYVILTILSGFGIVFIAKQIKKSN